MEKRAVELSGPPDLFTVCASVHRRQGGATTLVINCMSRVTSVFRIPEEWSGHSPCLIRFISVKLSLTHSLRATHARAVHQCEYFYIFLPFGLAWICVIVGQPERTSQRGRQKTGNPTSQRDRHTETNL